ncbi:MAG: flagellar FlbD family protein [Chloroflexi bacterium]|nr:flagellar FlbD family protein [Chloroflexota bacterium]
MVRLSRFDGSEFYINAELIESVEMTPDTVVSLTNGKKLVVRESAEEVVSRIVDYRRKSTGDRLLVSNCAGPLVPAADS